MLQENTFEYVDADLMLAVEHSRVFGQHHLLQRLDASPYPAVEDGLE